MLTRVGSPCHAEVACLWFRYTGRRRSATEEVPWLRRLYIMIRRNLFFRARIFSGELFLNYLVTGGAGFIGSHIVEALVAKGDGAVRVIDNLRSGQARNLDGMDVEFVEGSITDEALLDRAVANVDAVFHLAAMVSVPETMKYPRECMEINTLGTLQLLAAARRHGVQRVVFSSTSAVYGVGS